MAVKAALWGEEVSAAAGGYRILGMSGGGSVKAGREVAAGLREAKLRASIVSIFDQMKVVSDVSSPVGFGRIET